MPRDPFAFLQTESKERVLLLLLQALIRKGGGEARLSVTDLTSIDDGAGLFRRTSDSGDELVLCFARRGAEAYFLTEEAPSAPRPSRAASQVPITPLVQPRHAVHDDVDLAMREEEMAQRAETAQRERLRQARAASGAMPWRTETRQ